MATSCWVPELRRLSGFSSQWEERDRGSATSQFCRAEPWSHVQTARLPRGIKAIPTNLVFTFKPQRCSKELLLQRDWPSGGALCEQVACRSLPSHRWDRHKPRTVTWRHLRDTQPTWPGSESTAKLSEGAMALLKPRARLHLQPRPSRAGPFASNLFRFLERARCNQTKPR